MSRYEPWPKRFWDKVEVAGPDECWNWKASKNNYGYGMIYVTEFRMQKGAHRVSWHLSTGRPFSESAGYDICHKCDNAACVNPSHLFLGTRLDNVRDMIAKGRAALDTGLKGEDHGMAKLTEKQVISIRQRYAAGERKKHLAAEFGVHRSTIYLITTGKHWVNAGDSGALGVEATPKGERHYISKLTEDGVRKIRSEHAAGVRVAIIARDLAVSPGAVYQVLRGKSWKSVPLESS